MVEKDTPGEVPRTPAELADEYFRLATDSKLGYPGSSTAQSAKIALLCKISGHMPLVLERELALDADRISGLLSYANEQHKAAGVKVEITEDHLRGLIALDFASASHMMVLSEADLQGLLGIYPKRTELAGGEEAYSRAAFTLIQTRNGRTDQVTRPPGRGLKH